MLQIIASKSFPEYGCPETLISDNGPCYTLQAFTSVMQAYSVNHIISSLHYLQSNGLAEKYVQIVKSLFYKAKEEGKDFFKWMMIYCNTPLQVACSHQCRSFKAGMLDLTFLCQNEARKQLGIQPEIIRNSDKHAALPTNDLNVSHHMMYQDSTSKLWYPAVIDSLCSEPRSYKIITRDGIVYRKNPISSEAFYTSGQDVSIYQVCVFPIGTI